MTNIFRFNINLKLTTNQIYKKYGFLLGYYTVYEQNKNLKPENYNENYVASLRDTIEHEYKNDKKNSDDNINLIVIMSESFCDISKWEKINFSEDPIEQFHELQNDYTSGDLIVPVFGGSTCNTEYEFLTGNSLYFLKPSILPYEEPDIYFKKLNTESFVEILKQNNYKTIALHTYDGNFFNRNIVYKKIGFEKFISEKDFKNPEYKGLYISDNFFTDQIINICEENNKNKFFLFGITMQNHYPYNKEKYSHNQENLFKLKINNLNLNLNQKEKDSLECYLQGLKDANEELIRLINYLNSIEKKTILVFFGDHLPIIADSGFDFYKKINLINSNDVTEWSEKEYYNIYNTPYIIFNNFDVKKRELGELSPYFLSNELLNIINLEKNTKFKFLDIAFRNFRVLRENLFIKKNHESSNFINSDFKLINDFFCLEYKNIYN